MGNESKKEHDIFEKMADLHHGQLHFFSCPTSELQAIVAIDSLARGPALGGCRFVEYNSTHDAINDAIRLAKGMTLKAAVSNLDFGGGKTVIIKPKQLKNRQKLFERFGSFFHALNGQYITAMDSGTTLEDMSAIANSTDFVINLKSHHQFPTANPAQYTALGVLQGIKASVEHQYNKDNLDGLHVAIAGMGNVGQALGKLLINAGARLTVTDTNVKASNAFKEQFPATAICAPNDIHRIPCDVFSPCALGGCLNSTTISELNTTIVAGAANNQLLDQQSAESLHTRNILYAPDFVINAGGLIQATSLYLEHHEAKAIDKIHAIYDAMHTIFTRSKEKNQNPNAVALALAVEKLPIDQEIASKIYLN